MSILTGRGKVHLNGHKELSKDKPIKFFEAPNEVAIPLAIGQSVLFDVHVNVGDHVCVGTKLATRKDMYVPIYSPVSGTVTAIDKRMHVLGRKVNHVIIENDHQDESIKVLNIEDPEAMTAQDIKDAIKELGLVGLGGSGFPTYIKYGNTANIDTILINGVECEPYLTSDYLGMKRDIDLLFKGVCLMMKAAEASKAIIAIKVHKPDLFAMLQEHAAKYEGIEAVEVPDAYPMGWERTLVQTVFNKDYDRLPGEIGVIVNNASTAIALARGVYEGKGIYRRVVTISGEGVKDPQNVDVVVGMNFKDIIAGIGGYAENCEEGYVLNGGPMMGGSVPSDDFVVTMYTNGITVLPKQNPDQVACLKCGLCTLHCPARLQPVKIMVAAKRKDLDTLEKLETMRCVTCGTCAYICPSKIEVTDFISQGKRQITAAAALKKAKEARAAAQKK